MMFFRTKNCAEAEYTFFPTAKFKRECGCDADDVGFFLRDNELLKLVPVREKLVRDGLVTILIKEGRVTIRADEWVELSVEQADAMVSKGLAEVHGIDQISREYQSD